MIEFQIDVIRGAEMAWEPIKHTCGICGTINELILKLEYRDLENE